MKSIKDSQLTSDETRGPSELRASAVKPVYFKLDRPKKVRDKDRTKLELRVALDGLKTGGVKISVVAVAEAAGVHPSLIHHVYPEIAAEIAELKRGGGPSKQDRRDNNLTKALKDLDDLREKLSESEASIKSLISRNASLDARVRSLEATQKAASDAKVASLRPRGRGI